MSRFGNLGDTVQPPVLPPALGVSLAPPFIYRWVTHAGLVSLMTFFVAFVFVALVDSRGRWQRYPTAAVMTVFVILLTLCVWRTWEGRSAFVARLRRFLARPTMSDGGVQPVGSKSVRSNDPAGVV